MPLNDRDRKALKVGGIVAAVLVLALLGLGQLGKGGAPALPPLSVGPSTATGPAATGPGVTGPSESGSPSQGGPSPSPIFSGRDPFSLPPQFQRSHRPAALPVPDATGPARPVPYRRASTRRSRTDRRRRYRSRTDGFHEPADERFDDGHRRAHGRADRHVHLQRRLARHGRGRRHRLQPRRGCDVRGRRTSSCGTWRATAPRSCSATSPSRSASPRPSRRGPVPAIRPRGERSPARGRPRLGAAPAPSGARTRSL